MMNTKRRVGRDSYVLKGEAKGGTILVRTGPKLHRELMNASDQLGLSMNDFVVLMLRRELRKPQENNNAN